MRSLAVLVLLIVTVASGWAAVDVPTDTTTTISKDVTEDFTVRGTLVVRRILTGHINVLPGATVTVAGIVNGPIDVAANGAVTVAGIVNGPIVVTANGTVTIAGTLNGALRGDGQVRVAGIVTGDVTATHLVREQGCIINGVKQP